MGELNRAFYEKLALVAAINKAQATDEAKREYWRRMEAKAERMAKEARR